MLARWQKGQKNIMKMYFKKSYLVSAERVEPGTRLYNKLENCNYITNSKKCIRVIGTVGEEWPITIEKLRNGYTFEDGSEIDDIPNGVFEIKARADTNSLVFARRTTKREYVLTSWGDMLTANRAGIDHGKGDYIVYANKNGQPDPNDRWVVNGIVFKNTYQKA